MKVYDNAIVISVVIPTRERAETLAFTLRTAIEQEYDNLEILVSDNASNDSTRDVVKNYIKEDSRVRYINPGQRLGMSEHWEFALSHVRGAYVMFMGDDDGLFPSAIKNIARIINDLDKPELITWAQTTYIWPGVSKRFSPGLLRLPLIQKDAYTTADDVLPRPPYALGKLIMRGYPSIYNKSLVSIALINRIKTISGGTFFNSRIPDIYSGIVLGTAADRVPVIGRSFSINAQSSRSNGIAFNEKLNTAAQSEAAAFNAESQTQVHLGLGGRMTGLLPLLWWECVLQAKDKIGEKYSIRELQPESIIRSAFFSAHSISDDSLFNAEIANLLSLADQYGLSSQINQWKKLARRNKIDGATLAPGYDSSINCLSIDTIPYGIKDVYQAASMANIVLKLNENVFTPGWRYKQGLAHKYNYIRKRLSISNVTRYIMTRFR